jgi:hypothetical protein
MPKKITVIGAGVIGAATALALQKNNHDVLLLHRERPCADISFGNTGAIEYTWLGISCIGKNNANEFSQIAINAFAVGCYNSGGIGLGILYGQHIALYALGVTNDTTSLIQNRPKPERLTLQPMLKWGIALRLKKDRYFATTERLLAPIGLKSGCLLSEFN